MTKSIFRDISFLEVLNWVTVHSQTEKCVDIISTPSDWWVENARIVQIALAEYGENLPSQQGNGKFWGRERLFHWVVKIFLGAILTI